MVLANPQLYDRELRVAQPDQEVTLLSDTGDYKALTFDRLADECAGRVNFVTRAVMTKK